ncbi:PAP2 superfamily protein [Halogranum amylolyticum]|uniref:PAP2 superfamily protein n=1 Tax=Halogranum amylolyticum TaxID=660520 RepID=A0A1H8MYB6_9EURY|nr:phosphatase PAP2 family protein [Halogranum amylolyticum]SEO22259.1 PAP2 superfamily protein [Halogranum amylolyticum]
MVRLVELSRLVADAVPPEFVPVFAAITTLGGATALMLLLSVLYWTAERRATALVVSFTLTALGVVLALKAGFGLPRPPAAEQLVTHDNDPWGFPSGHAVAAVVAYGGLVVATDRFRSRWAAVAAGVLALLVGLSRVVIGVHYLGDVLVGFAVGLALLGGLWRLTDGSPRRGFAIATLASVPALVVAGVMTETLVALGGSIGGWLGSTKLDELPDPTSRLERGLLIVAGLGFIVVVRTVQTVASGIGVGVVALNAVLVAGILLLPLATTWRGTVAVPFRRVG